MKQVEIIYNEAIEIELLTCLKKKGITTFTKFQHVLGVGTHSEPHMGTHVWPGENNALFIVSEDEKVPEILHCVRTLKKKKLKEGIKAFVLPVEESV
ncbi:MAG: hypothetical protein GXO76_00570 [Calditrichaeota bacterium]|nr:hypothetical protein [Calditrichota bacterium]